MGLKIDFPTLTETSVRYVCLSRKLSGLSEGYIMVSLFLYETKPLQKKKKKLWKSYVRLREGYAMVFFLLHETKPLHKKNSESYVSLSEGHVMVFLLLYEMKPLHKNKETTGAKLGSYSRICP